MRVSDFATVLSRRGLQSKEEATEPAGRERRITTLKYSGTRADRRDGERSMLVNFSDYADFLDSEVFIDDKGFNVSDRLWQHSLPSTVSRIPNRCVARNQGKLLVKPSPCWPFCCSQSAAAVASPSNVELADTVDTEAVYWRPRVAVTAVAAAIRTITVARTAPRIATPAHQAHSRPAVVTVSRDIAVVPAACSCLC